MVDYKDSMKKLLLLGVVIVIVVVIVLVAFLALGIIFSPLTSPSVETTNNYEDSQTITQPTNPTQSTNQNQTPSEPQQSQESVVQESLWGIIQQPLVEKICLEQAKVQAGDLSWAVNSCSCSESIGEEQKNYICSVSAIDGLHAVDISCSKINANCNINSEYGVFVYTFEKLQHLVN